MCKCGMTTEGQYAIMKTAVVVMRLGQFKKTSNKLFSIFIKEGK